jgi:spoIIIJ-associated protein
MNAQDLSSIQQAIEKLIQLMEIEAKVTIELDESNIVKVQIDGDDLGALIGYHGETLSALQTVIGLMINRDLAESEESRYKVVVNVGDYRQRQKESLEALARRSAERVRFTKKPLTLSPMSSYDRRIVHLALEREPDVVSESTGEGRERRLIVKLRQD